jgi:serine/threonine protein kinase
MYIYICMLGQSRRDDMESLGYVLLYLILGKLPWFNSPGDGQIKIDNVIRKRMTTTISQLCQHVPGNIQYIHYYISLIYIMY